MGYAAKASKRAARVQGLSGSLNQRRIAIHEAAHATAAVAVNMRLLYATVNPLPKHNKHYLPDAGGVTVYKMPLGSRATTGNISLRIFTTIVAEKAQALVCADYLESYCRNDYEQASSWLLVLKDRHGWTKSQTKRWAEQLDYRTKKWVVANIESIKAVAAGLLTHGILGAPAIKTLCPAVPAFAPHRNIPSKRVKGKR